MSGWSMVEPGQFNLGVDVADAASAGAGAIAPVNAKVYGSYFSTGLVRDRGVGMCAFLKGYGAGGGIGAGWGVPFFGADAMGRVPGSIKRKVLEAIGKEAQGKGIDWLKKQAWGGIAAGTRMVTGPDSNGSLSLGDFHNAFATVISLGANFVVNGASFGLVIFSQQRPVLQSPDLVYATAFGLMGGTGLATSLDIEATGLIYKVQVA